MQNNSFNLGTTRSPRAGRRATNIQTLGLLKVAALLTLTAAMAHGQTDPWSNAAGHLSAAFTGPIAKGLSLVALVLGGIELAFGEGNSRRVVGGLVFGLALAIGAAQFLAWITS